MFIEMDWKVEFPTYLFAGMIVISLMTVFFSVYIPMRSHNKRTIASALKATGN